MTDVRLCRDCKWMKPDKTFWWLLSFKSAVVFSKCGNPAARGKVQSPDVVVGSERLPIPPYCSIERGSWNEPTCGPEGKNWELKK